MKISTKTIAAFTLCGGLTGNLIMAQVAPPTTPPENETSAVIHDEVIKKSHGAGTSSHSQSSATSRHFAFAEAHSTPENAYDVVTEVSEAPFSVGEFRWDGGGLARPRTLVIRAAEADDKTMSSLEEDLNVMSRILSKATKTKGSDDEAVTAMGMKIKELTLASHSGAQNFYLDGYGALFVLTVRFPLLPPPETSEKETSKEPADSSWEEAKRELYGARASGGTVRLWDLSANRAREEYDAKKVAKLKESLLQALQNASNIRNLKSNEFVTVAVVGADNSPMKAVALGNVVVRSEGRRAGDTAKGNFDRVVAARRSVRDAGAAGGETMLTIRVKKSDVDAFAKGNLSLEEFRKKASVSVY